MGEGGYCVDITLVSFYVVYTSLPPRSLNITNLLHLQLCCSKISEVALVSKPSSNQVIRSQPASREQQIFPHLPGCGPATTSRKQPTFPSLLSTKVQIPDKALGVHVCVFSFCEENKEIIQQQVLSPVNDRSATLQNVLSAKVEKFELPPYCSDARITSRLQAIFTLLTIAVTRNK